MVARRPEPPRGKGRWITGVVVLLIFLGAGAYLWQRRNAAQAETALPARTIRTAPVTAGVLEATVRLTGTTSAENFVSLISPQLRGSRAGTGRDRVGVSAAAAPPKLSVTPSVSASSGGNLSAALKASTSRLSSATAAGASGSTASSAGSAAMGSSGLGSTSDALQGGGGGGGDWNLVLQKLVKPGSQVKKGQTIAEFDRESMLTRLDDYRASVIQTQASLLNLKSQLTITRDAFFQNQNKAKGILDKAKLDLKTIPVLSNIDAERAKLAVQDAQARYTELANEEKLMETSLGSQIRSAEIDLQQSNIELRRAEGNVSKMIIKAPIDGLTVMSTIPRGGDLGQVQEGDQVWPGMMFMQIVDPRSMVINANVNQADVERLRLGQRAKIHFDAYPGLELAAHIYSVGGLAKPGGMRASFVKEIPVRLKLDTLDPRVIPDLSVSADVIVETDTNTASIAPLGAIFRDTPSTAPYVFVRGPSGWNRRDVTIGLVNNVAAAIRSGLKENDVVAMEQPPDSETKASAQ